MTHLPHPRTDWPDLIGVAAAQHLTRELRAELLSLSGLQARDINAALASLLKAKRLEPLNPLHELRQALTYARFGDLASAFERLEALKAKLPDAPLPDYLRALLALRSGKLEQARAIAATLESANKDFIPVKFLRAEISILLAGKAQGVERTMTSLPTGAKWEAAWADLLVKAVLLRPADGVAIASRYVDKKLASGGPAAAFVSKAIAWATASSAEIAALLAETAPGSTAEALLLESWGDKLGREPVGEALRLAAELCKQPPDRPALARVRNALLMLRAIEASADGNYEDALRFVAMCVRDQPHDPIYQQNRAALFTLLREAGAYHEAWAALNAHQYQLTLLGVFDAASVSQIVRTHRLFAQQARGGAAGDAVVPGVFKAVPSEGGERNRLAFNAEEIAADPDLLRQWMHHGAAELLFRHIALMSDPRRMLLYPEDRDEAADRARGLTALGNSLVTLVPEQGAELAARIAQKLQAATAAIKTRYRADGAEPSAAHDGADAEAERLRRDHIQVIADVCLICLQWHPQLDHLWIAEELLAFADALLPFFDEALLRRMQSALGYETPFPILVLAENTRAAQGTEKAALPASAQKRTPFGSFKAELLSEMGMSVYNASSGTPKESAVRAMVYIDRARTEDPANADVELKAATLLALGGYLDDARHALDRFQQLVKPENQRAIEQSRRVEELLQDRRKDTPKAERFKRDGSAETAPQRADATIEERLKDLDRAPSSYRLYEELVRALSVAGRFGEAVQWADRSVAQCLNRADQMTARGLAIEARALAALAQSNPQAARVFAAGSHQAARKAIEAAASEHTEALSYPLMYLLGRCQLAAGLPSDARRSFERAGEACEMPLHRTVLRHLAGNIDNAYLAIARTAANEAMQNGSVAEAIEGAGAVFARLDDPAAWLIEFAQIHYNAAAVSIGETSHVSALSIELNTAWRQELANALAKESYADRALALAALAEQLHPPSARAASALSARVRSLQHQIAVANALKQAGELVRAQRFAEALSFLDSLGDIQNAEPRLLRIRVLALLRLERFAEADDAIMLIGEGGPDEVRAFVSQYPELVFRQRMATIRRLLKGAGFSDARALMAGAVPITATDTADLAYCRAFAMALEGYDLRKQGREGDARTAFLDALQLIEPHLNCPSWDARPAAELCDRLEKEIDHDGR